SVLFRKSNLEKTGLFDEDLGGKIGYGADGAMWHKMGYHFRFAFIDKALVYYRLHAGQVSHQADVPRERERYRRYMTEYFTERDAAGTVAGVIAGNGQTVVEGKGTF
ncbi:MAG TPA: hypothetical protein VLB27_08405, partial [candidate division Zixibacteria bacterium]|nr:hypothetical protein [candidate division Zixibacteria bacterium]